MSKRQLVSFCALTMWAWGAAGQTRIDLKNQGRGVDFSEAAYTKPAKSGPSLPVSCGTGEMYLLTTGPAGNTVYVCTATNVWSLQGGTASASGAPNTLQVSRTSGTVLTIGTDCSASAPCNVRGGGSVYSFVNSATVTLSAGTGTAYVYVSGSGALTAGHNVSLSCAGGCVAQPGITSFPVTSVPIAIWTASSGAWQTGVGMDVRSFLSRDFVANGPGLTIVSGPGYQSIGVDQAVVGLRTSVPASATSSCTPGAWAADSSFYYLCAAANAWRRAALSSW